MFIERLRLKSVRTFVDETLEFIHPDRSFGPRKKASENGSPRILRPRLPNVNLLLGDNGSGKSTVLRAIAMAALGPSFEDTKLSMSEMVRRAAGEMPWNPQAKDSHIEADLFLHDQDQAPGKSLRSGFSLTRRGELERARFALEADNPLERATHSNAEDPVWKPVFESRNPAFFAVGYGATRRVEAREDLNLVARSKSIFLRAQRLQGLFQESYALIPLSAWFLGHRGMRQVDHEEIALLLNRLLRPTRCTYTGKAVREGDSLFEKNDVEIEFRNLSDGYRAFIGWAADMLFHAYYATPEKTKLVDLCGIVMVDEIDLHLHPRWQMKVISTIARTFPRMQFIFTSHSPLVAGSLEWMNIIMLKLGKSNSTRAINQFKEGIHGLDADQVLLSRFFGLSTTRAAEKASKLDRLTLKARGGDDDAARRLIAELAKGMEDAE
jgi:energy-coupling factor transporter ATP-binding protein EcfA2